MFDYTFFRAMIGITRMKFTLTPLALSLICVVGSSNIIASSNDAEYTYLQLKALQNENSGHPEFDFRFAVVAMAVHQYDEAIFALERLLQNDPNNGRVRAELARCYYETGQYHLSRSLFDQIKDSSGVPETVRSNINYYLHQMDKRGSEFDLNSQIYLEAGIGHDSNVNAGSDLSSVTVPNLGTVGLTEASQSQSDSTRQMGAGFYLAKANSRHRLWSASGQIKRNDNADYSDYDQQSIDADISYHIRSGDDRYRVSLQYQNLQLDGENFFSSRGVVGQWTHQMDDQLQLGLSVNIHDVVFNEVNAYRDHTRQIVGAELLYADGPWMQRLVLFLGREMPKTEKYDYALREALRGLSYRLSYQYTPMLIPYFAMQYNYGDYGDVHPIFQMERNDSFRAYEMGVLWQPTSQWIVNPSLTDARNQSDIEAYSYDRERAQVNVRYSF